MSDEWVVNNKNDMYKKQWWTCETKSCIVSDCIVLYCTVVYYTILCQVKLIIIIIERIDFKWINDQH